MAPSPTLKPTTPTPAATEDEWGSPGVESTPTTRSVSERAGSGYHTGSTVSPAAEPNVREEATEFTGLLTLSGSAGRGDRRGEGGGDGDDGPGGNWTGHGEFEGLPWWKRPSVWFLVVPYALFTLAFGGSVVPKLNLIVDLICQKYLRDRAATDPNFTFTPVVPGGNNRQCFAPDVQKLVAKFSLVLSVTSGILSSLTAPKLGALSDRYGRKRLLIICSLGGIASETVTILAARHPQTIDYRWMILGSVFDGLTGSFTAGSVLSHAYASDCTPPSQRGVAIGYLHSCLFAGMAFGPLLAGYFVEWTGSLVSIFYVVLGCHLFFMLFIGFVTPESLSKKQRRLARVKYAQELQDAAIAAEAYVLESTSSPLNSRGDPLSFLISGITILAIKASNPFRPLRILFDPTDAKGTPQADTRRARMLRRNLLTLALTDMVILGSAMSAGGIMVLYVEATFGWDNLESSRFMSMTSLVRVTALMGVLPAVNWVFRTRPLRKRKEELARAAAEGGEEEPKERNAGADTLDLWILRCALLSEVIGVAGYIFARSAPVFVASAVVASLGGLGSATIQAALSKHVPPERVGQLLGAIGLLHSLARVFGPMVFNQLYAATVETAPRAFFILLWSVFAGALGASFLVTPHVYLKSDDELSDSRPSTRGSNRVRQDLLEDEELFPETR